MSSLSENLHGGGRAIATWLAIGNSYSAELVSSAGFDCLVLDTQHGAITWDNLGQVIQAVDLHQVPSLVRVGGVDQIQVMRALDLGAAGVIVPMVSTPEEAKTVAMAMDYPPNGLRSFGKVRNYYGNEAASTRPLCFVMIETAEGMENLDAIAAVDGVDGLFVGPVDLGLGLGLGPVLTANETVMSAIAEVADACKRHGKISASASLGADYSRELAEKGVQLIVQGSDLGYIRRCMTQDVQQLREMLAD